MEDKKGKGKSKAQTARARVSTTLGERFHQHFPLEDGRFKELWKTAYFVADTNVLLNAYFYTPEMREKMFRIFDELGDRFFVPHQVGLEFFDNRFKKIDAIYSQPEFLRQEVNKSLEEVRKQIRTVRNRHPFIDAEKLLEELQPLLQKVEEVVGEHCLESDKVLRHMHTDAVDRFRNDSVLKLVEKLRSEAALPEQEHAAAIKDSTDRKKTNVPPGYEDKSHGDFIIWRQLIAFSKEHDVDIVFVTDDKKADWWLKIGGKTVGPRPELLTEFGRETGHQYLQFSANGFFELANELVSENEKFDENELKTARNIATHSRATDTPGTPFQNVSVFGPVGAIEYLEGDAYMTAFFAAFDATFGRGTGAWIAGVMGHYGVELPYRGFNPTGEQALGHAASMLSRRRIQCPNCGEHSQRGIVRMGSTGALNLYQWCEICGRRDPDNP